MIQHGAEKIIDASNRYAPLHFVHPSDTDCSMMIDDDIDDIIKKGEDKTAELNSKYAGLNLDALNNFKSESMVNTWEGEDFAGAKVSYCLFSQCLSTDDLQRKSLIWIEPAKRERKGNYSIDQYYRDNLKTGGPKADKPKVARAPKQVHINDFQFYPPRLVELQNREFDAHRVSLRMLSCSQLMELSFAESTDLRCAHPRTG